MNYVYRWQLTSDFELSQETLNLISDQIQIILDSRLRNIQTLLIFENLGDNI